MQHFRTLIPLSTLLVALLAVSSPGQQPVTTQEAPAAAKARTKPRGRLPAYYAQVVSATQREKIYAIQLNHAAQVEALEAQLKDLQTKIQGEIRSVLTPEQQKKVDELAEAARKSRGGKAAIEQAAVPSTTTPAATPASNVKRAAK